jgi:hypothetical protein
MRVKICMTGGKLCGHVNIPLARGFHTSVKGLKFRVVGQFFEEADCLVLIHRYRDDVCLKAAIRKANR